MNRQPRHVLLIDDSPDDRAEIRRMLLRGAQRRYEFTEAALGAECLHLLREAAPGTYDCVLLDFHLPDIDALEVLAAMRADTAKVPVLVITGSDLANGQELLQAGAQDYIGKEWTTPQSLTRALDNAVERFGLVQALQLAKADAEKATQAKSQFLSHMSHELRSPLSSIIGFAQLLASGAPTPTALQSESIEQILHAGWHLLELVNDVLDLAVIDSGQLELPMQSLPLAKLLGECQAMMTPQAQQRDVQLHFNLPHDALCVRADGRRAKQVFINLLSNAIKYNRPGGRVDVGCSLEMSPGQAPSVRISVSDTGVGIAAQHMAQVFEPFGRLERTAGATEGAGIGLAVSQRLMAAMNGAIGAYSRHDADDNKHTPEIGTVFWAEFGLATVEPAAPTVEPRKEQLTS